MRIRLALSLLGSLFFCDLTMDAAMAGGAEQQPPPEDLAPGDVLWDHGVGVEVPSRGHSTYGIALGTKGVQVLGVVHHVDGRISIEAWGDDGAPQRKDAGRARILGGPAACDDGAYYLRTWIWETEYQWYFRSGSVPSYLDAFETLQAARRATTNITHSENNCGEPDEVDATAQFIANTTRSVNVNSDGSCPGDGDSYSVTGFGALPSDLWGKMCVFAIPRTQGRDRAEEADVKINQGDWGWYIHGVTACDISGSPGYSVEAVLTHERGHVFGLGHVSEETHGNLTMSTLPNGPCQDSESSLGWGDIRGLRVLY